MASNREREEEFVEELAEAVFGDDLTRARAALTLMANACAGALADAVARGKRKALPLPPVPDLAVGVALPMPGRPSGLAGCGWPS